MNRLALAAAMLMVAGTATSADAAVTLVLRPAAGYDLSSVVVGDTIELELAAVGSAGENFERGGGGTRTISPNLSLLRVSTAPTLRDDFSTSPGLFVYQVQATAPGVANLSVAGFTVISNLARYNNLSARLPDFIVGTAAVPEPATWGLMLAGFGLVGAGLRSRRVRFARAAA